MTNETTTTDQLVRAEVHGPGAANVNNFGDRAGTIVAATTGLIAALCLLGVILLFSHLVTLSMEVGETKARAEAAHDTAIHAQQEADLAKYFIHDIEKYMADSGLHPPADPWMKRALNRQPSKGRKK